MREMCKPFKATFSSVKWPDENIVHTFLSRGLESIGLCLLLLFESNLTLVLSIFLLVLLGGLRSDLEVRFDWIVHVH